MKQIEYKHFVIHISPLKTAKRLRLRYMVKQRHFQLTVPPYTTKKAINLFLQQVEPWLEKHNQSKGEVISITHGVEIPILGQSCLVHFHTDTKKKVVFAPNQLTIFHPYDAHKILLDVWLKEHAQQFLMKKSKEFAKQLGVGFKKVTVRDTTSRWGSCSSSGNLAYSWRVIFAPLEVAEYLCAHEVSHLKYMNHSQEFWNTVASICPNYKTHRQWLRTHGKQLFIYL